ncbi:MAG: hypothetical protein LLF93_00235 [Bacteroidales bacterium]|nr:hypothetical protein [Bacteroidales bacterium]
MTWDEEFESLFDLPIFEDVRIPAAKISTADRLFRSFEEINQFFEQRHTEPNIESSLNEKLLARTLKSIRENSHKKAALLPFDIYNLLK